MYEVLYKKCKFIILVFSPAVLVYIQAEELRKFLWAKNVPAKVYVGMRY
jgi:hypothetical protein